MVNADDLNGAKTERIADSLFDLMKHLVCSMGSSLHETSPQIGLYAVSRNVQQPE